jgi:hypothetical protein
MGKRKNLYLATKEVRPCTVMTKITPQQSRQGYTSRLQLCDLQWKPAFDSFAAPCSWLFKPCNARYAKGWLN